MSSALRAHKAKSLEHEPLSGEGGAEAFDLVFGVVVVDGGADELGQPSCFQIEPRGGDDRHRNVDALSG